MKIGDKVVCIDDDARDSIALGIFRVEGELPARGHIYVIRGFHFAADGLLALKLVGRTVFNKALGCETGFRASRFRPLEWMKELAAARRGDQLSVTTE